MQGTRRSTLLAAAAVGVLAVNEILQAVRSHAFFWADDYSHLVISRNVTDLLRSGDVRDAMTTLLDGWGRPLMTLAYIPGAMLGDNAVRVTSLLLLFSAAGFCAATARRHALPLPLVAAVLFLAQPLTATLGFVALPALLFTTLLAAAFWLRARGNVVLAAVVISFLPLARLEGLVVIGLCALFALRSRQLRVLAALGVGTVVWIALSTVFVQDPLWPLHSAYTTTLSSQWPREPLTYVFGASYLAFGPVVAGLALASPFVRRFADPLVPLSAGALIAFYGAVWTIGAFESLPNPVYLMSAAAPVALCAHAALAALLERRPAAPVRGWFLVAVGFTAVGFAIGEDRVALGPELAHGRRVLLVALAAIAVHQFAERLARAAELRRLAFGGAIVLAVVFGVGMTHARPVRGTPKLVAQVREEFGDRLNDVLYSNDPTFDWEVDPKPISVARQHATGTLLIWNPGIASHKGAASDEELVRLGFRQLWVASDAGDTLAVWERVEIRRLPGES